MHVPVAAHAARLRSSGLSAVKNLSLTAFILVLLPALRFVPSISAGHRVGIAPLRFPGRVWNISPGGRNPRPICPILWLFIGRVALPYEKLWIWDVSDFSCARK